MPLPTTPEERKPAPAEPQDLDDLAEVRARAEAYRVESVVLIAPAPTPPGEGEVAP